MPEPKLIGWVLVCTKEDFIQNNEPDFTDGSVLMQDKDEAKTMLRKIRRTCDGQHILVPVYVD